MEGGVSTSRRSDDGAAWLTGLRAVHLIALALAIGLFVTRWSTDATSQVLIGGLWLSIAGILALMWRRTHRKWILGLAIALALPVSSYFLASFEGGQFSAAGIALIVSAITEPHQWLCGSDA